MSESKKEEKSEDQKRAETTRRRRGYTNAEPNDNVLKDFLLAYLQCCYGAFIALFIGMVAVPIIPIKGIEGIALKMGMTIGFWLVEGYYLMQIIYTYGELDVLYKRLGVKDLSKLLSKEVKELGFPYKYLNKVNEWLGVRIRKSEMRKKYVGIVLGYIGLLVVFLIIALISS